MSLTKHSLVDWLTLAARVFLGGFYIVAGAVKIPDPGKFAQAVENYRILPHELINLVAITLPWIEVVAGVLFVLGIWLRASGWLINSMTVVFIVAIASALRQGLNIECGCFGTVGGRSVGSIAIAEDLFLLACGIWVLWRARRRTFPQAVADLAVPSPRES